MSRAKYSKTGDWMEVRVQKRVLLSPLQRGTASRYAGRRGLVSSHVFGRPAPRSALRQGCPPLQGGHSNQLESVYVHFLKQFLTNPMATGAVAPSSAALAQVMIEDL